VAEQFKLRLVGEAALGGLAHPRARLGTLGDHGERHHALRAVRPVDQPRRDLPGAVPGAQRGP